jgi:diguanylate cyclase (GGDEF)-like protein
MRVLRDQVTIGLDEVKSRIEKLPLIVADGLTLEGARTLAEALRVLSTQPPHCTLVSLQLPDALPSQVVEALRSVVPEHPIVVVTSHPERGAGVRAVSQGAQDYLIKGSMSADGLDRALRYAVDRSRSEAVLAHQALHDALTGLPNRTLLMERLDLAVARLERDAGLAALMFIDLDRFKLVNDTLGHAVGDELLAAVGERLRAHVRRADLVARFGGDEFVVLVERLAAPGDVAALAEQLLAQFAEPFASSAGEHWLSASVGVAVLDGSVPADVLLANADTAMYRAKETAHNQWAVFDDGMHAELLRRMQIEQELAGAVDTGQLRLHYQPIHDERLDRVVGAEALLRWQHPVRGLVSPAEFLPVAEDSGQIVAIGAWVVTQACLQTRSWIDAGVVDASWTTWVNVSTRQLDRPGLEEAVRAALSVARLPPARLGLEITESAFLRDADGAARVTARLHALGVRLAVDDFGTGYSSMRRLRELPLDHLKIDASFVAGLAEHPADRAIVLACVQLADAMGMSSVAEGVETPEQRAELRLLGCHLSQGYWLSPALPPQDFKQLLLDRLLRLPTGGGGS